MAMKRHRQPLEIMAEMNITNLLDTAFILLITFMLVAPQLTHGLKIALPEVKGVPSLPMEPDNTLLISILRKDAEEPEERIIMDKIRVTVDEVYEKVHEKHQANPDVAVVIEADEASSSGMLLKVLGAVGRGGVLENVWCSAQPAKLEN